jgi:hypothetical protein
MPVLVMFKPTSMTSPLWSHNNVGVSGGGGKGSEMPHLHFGLGTTYISVTWSYDLAEDVPISVTVNRIDSNNNIIQSEPNLAGLGGTALFTPLTPNTSYLFEWCGIYIAEGVGEFTSCIAPQSATTANPPPPPPPKSVGPPVNVTASDASVGLNLKVHLSWRDGQGQLPTGSFEVQRFRLANTSGPPEQDYPNLPAALNSLDDTALLALRQPYIYLVTARDSANTSKASNWSNSVEIFPPPAPPPGLPSLASRLAAGSWGPNTLVLFGRGTDSSMYHQSWIQGWGPAGWLDLGGKFSFNLPAAVVSGPAVQNEPIAGDRIDVFGIGTDSAVYHLAWTFNQGWMKSWESLGGKFISPPAAVSWGSNRLDVFGIGTDSGMYHKWWDGNAWGPSPSGWESLGGKFTSLPVAVSRGPNRLDVFGRSMDMALYYKVWTGTHWMPSPTDWESLGGKFVSPPAVVPNAGNYLDAFGIGLDGGMYHKFLLASGWLPARGNWDSLGGQFKSWPSAVSWGPNRLDIFGIGMDSAMYHKWWKPMPGGRRRAVGSH